MKDLPWDDIKLVKSIADAKGLSGAAERLGVNHSTVFRRLKTLEDALGVKLFERHRGGYAPTPTGEEMLALAERIDDAVAGFSRRVAGREISPAGEVRVTTSDSLLMHLLTPVLARFRAAYPEVTLDLVVGNQVLNLSKRDADIAVRATDSPPQTLVGRRIAQIAWALYGRAEDFPDPLGVEQSDLGQRYWISVGDNFSGFKVHQYVRENVPPERVAYKINTVLGLAEAVEAGIGIGLLPCFIGDTRPALVRLSAPDPIFAATLWLLTHPDLRHAPRVRAFMDFVAAEVVRERRLIEGWMRAPYPVRLEPADAPA